MRRYIAALCVLILFTSVALADTYAFNYEGGSAVVDENGIALIAHGTYESIHTLRARDGSIAGYAAGVSTNMGIRYALLSPAGDELTDFIYASIEAADGQFICGVGGSYWIVSATGAVASDPYSAIVYAGDGAFLTLSENINDGIADPLVFLAANGIKWQPGIDVMYGLGAFSEDLMPVCDGGSMQFGYIGRDGIWKIAAQYEYAGEFIGGHAVVSTRTGYGVIDKTGAFVLDAHYDFIERDDAHILALGGGMLSMYTIGADGLEKLFERNADGASPRLSGESLILYASDGVAVLSAAGEELFTASPTASVSEAGGLYVIRDGDWDEAGAYLAGTDGVQISEKYNTIRLLDGEGEGALFAYGVMAADSYDMKFGLMRGDGAIVTDGVYDEVARVGPGLFCAVTAGDAALIDGAGNELRSRG